MIRKYLRGKVDAWKEHEEALVSQRASNMTLNNLSDLTSKVDPEFRGTMVQAIGSNPNFYVRVAAIKRAEELTLLDHLKYSVYGLLDKVV